MSLLTINNLSVSANGAAIVKKISFSIGKGEWVAVVGQSGSGKSVTASALGQLLGPNLKAEGEVQYKGDNLLALPLKKMRKLRGTSLSYVFQDYQGSFTPFLTIGRHFDEYQKAHLSLSRSARKQQAQEALVSVGLKPEMYSRYPFQLSGGQLQRVSIALALLLRPDLLIADEPTTALDSISSFKILELLSSLQKQTGCSILFITHDLRHVKNYADRIVVMKEGEIVEQGEKAQIMGKPKHPYTQLLIDAASSLKASFPLRSKEVAK
ncbi:peptide/nickel transport system ATP-binding protein [Planomicrobium soli]|uniref:Peptide/nickel transport system ATP-binding protein n=1 Tax=Planomicrobium soli TaxID=1176648 RepID=A0A2P8H1H1_9BACL|nr:ABC transporter ATP-binding protein [Planomicrobium soli]PSL40062.1 peptide/nickel transport system ATP-binding protein [Planomicrobium soli]